jgi:hypothetical protein
MPHDDSGGPQTTVINNLTEFGDNPSQGMRDLVVIG